MEIKPEDFWRRVKERQSELGLTEGELAAKCKMTYHALHQGAWRGSMPKLDTAFKLAEGLDVNIERLALGSDPRDKVAVSVIEELHRRLDEIKAPYAERLE